MYAKLMSRITESSLMEESIPTRYCFIMMLAIADPKGYVVGTDVAIARRINMPIDEFDACINELMSPDPDSNSKEQEGRRVILSDCERGYFLVNYGKYRDTRDEEERREYMRKYMQARRSVNSGKLGKPQLANAEEEVDAEAEVSEESEERGEPMLCLAVEESNTITVETIYQAYPKKVGKKHALSAIAKALKEITPAALLEAVQAWAAANVGADLQFMKDPATWFNAGCYSDDRSTWGKKPPNGSQPQSRPPAPFYDLEQARAANRRKP